jgi:hypothetical protein
VELGSEILEPQNDELRQVGLEGRSVAIPIAQRAENPVEVGGAFERRHELSRLVVPCPQSGDDIFVRSLGGTNRGTLIFHGIDDVPRNSQNAERTGDGVLEPERLAVGGNRTGSEYHAPRERSFRG